MMATTTLNLDAVMAALVARGCKPRLTAKQRDLLAALAQVGARLSVNRYGDSVYVLTAPDGVRTPYSAMVCGGLPLHALCAVDPNAPYGVIVYILKAAFIAD